MKVILLKDVRKVGRKGEVKEVTDGFGTNFLLPQKLASAATPERIAEIEMKHAAAAAAAAAEEAALGENLRALHGRRIELALPATPKGGLFKSIAAADIARIVRDQAHADIPDTAVILDAPIKTAGEHPVRLRSKHASADITLVLTPAG